MKLPFFKTSTTISEPLDVRKNDLSKLISDHFKNEFSKISGFITIVYTFTSTHGRSGDHFSAKLAESGDIVHYSTNKNKKYQISGRTGKIKSDEKEIAQILSTKIEMGATYNCVLTEWNITKVEILD